MGNIIRLFGCEFTPPRKEITSSPQEQLAEKIRAHIDCDLLPSDVIMDGEIHRFSVGGKRNKNGWYVVFPDGVPAGAFGDWSQSLTVDFVADMGRNLTVIERMANTEKVKRAREYRQKVREKRSAAVANVVSELWAEYEPAGGEQPYIKRKQVKPHGTKINDNGDLVVPIYGPIDGPSDAPEIVSLQTIKADGAKRFYSGGRVLGGWFVVGDITNPTSVCIAEGFATAASVYEQTGVPCLVSFSASNITPVAKMARNVLGEQCDIIIVADHDEGGVGVAEAKKACDAVGARYVVPPDVGTDANDYTVAGGDLNELIAPQHDDFLVHISEFIKQPAPIKWLIKGWLQCNALMMLFGPPGAGKSFIAIDWACHIAAGVDSWNGQVVRGGPVVYLAGEGHHGMRARVAGWVDANGVSGDDVPLYISQYGTDLNTAQGYTKVANALKARGIAPSLIIIDTLHRFLHGDENSAEDAKTMIDACNGLMREFDCSVMMVHHTGVSPEAQKRGRGSSAWKGALDIELCVSGDHTISQTKTKDSEPLDDIKFELLSRPIPGWLDEDGEQVTTAVVNILGSAVKKTKDSSRVHTLKTLIKDAWAESGFEFGDNGLPYIAEAALQRFLMSPDNGLKQYSERTAVSYAASGGDRNGTLLKEGWLISYRDGFCIVASDETEASVLDMMAERGK